MKVIIKVYLSINNVQNYAAEITLDIKLFLNILLIIERGKRGVKISCENGGQILSKKGHFTWFSLIFKENNSFNIN